MDWLQDYGWIIGAIVAAALALAGLARREARRRVPRLMPVHGAAARRRVDLTFAAAVLVTLAAGWVAVQWLLAQADQVAAGKERAALRADAVKTGATIALGTGGAAYLLLAYRRQRLEEVDTRERRITELFTKAVDELGHEKAPVRLGALYSLERLAQTNPEQRQTVIDVICAYLRMPYPLPARSEPDAEQAGEEAAASADNRDRAPHPAPEQDAAQELQVRKTAQRILGDHLNFLPPGIFGIFTGIFSYLRRRRRRRSPTHVGAHILMAQEGASILMAQEGARHAQRRRPSSRRPFWPGMSLDLTSAALVDFDFAWVSVVRARFDGATFQGRSVFVGATFQRFAEFGGATFQGAVTFQWATFQGVAGFDGASFEGEASFGEATFRGYTHFDGARVLHLDDRDLNKLRVWPDGCTVHRDAADRTRGTLVCHGVEVVRPRRRPRSYRQAREL